MLSNSKEQALLKCADDNILSLYSDFETIKKSIQFASIKISIDKQNFLTRFRDERYLDEKLQYLDDNGIHLLHIEDPKYPNILKNIYSAPRLLYAKGDLSLLQKPCVAIVGTRHSTRYGQETTKKLAKDLVDCGIVVVSGLATGIDTYAHTASLEYSGKTIAVLGGGFNHISPTSNTNLSKQIATNGLLLTEYAPNTESQSWMFVQRNRIVSGISQGVIVVEAGLKSGAGITANMALEQGKTVFSVPGNISSPQSMGTNELIKDGAVLTTDGFMVAQELGISKKIVENAQIAPIALDIFEEKVYTLLSKGKKHFDNLVIDSGCSARELGIILSSMELKKLISKQPNNYYTLSH